MFNKINIPIREILKMKWFIINFIIFIKSQELRSETVWCKWEKIKSVFAWMEVVYVTLRKQIKGNIKVKVIVKNKIFSKCIFV